MTSENPNLPQMLPPTVATFLNCTAIDLCDLGLDKIDEDENEFRIGAYATLRQIETHEALNAYTHGAIAESVRHIVGVQFRNVATVGGSIWGTFAPSALKIVMTSENPNLPQMLPPTVATFLNWTPTICLTGLMRMKKSLESVHMQPSGR